MRLSRFTLAAAMAMAALAITEAQTPQMSVADIRPGMVATGRTVFTGTKVEEFKAHILGVIGNVIGTRRDLILARLEGGPLAQTGVIAGMSGSPVYIDGKLVGAVSYSLGSFSREPIAGITPIAEMTDATALTAPRAPGTRVQVEFPLSRENFLNALRTALGGRRAFADRPSDAMVLGDGSLLGSNGREVATMLRPIATPLVMSGFEPDLMDLLGGAFRDNGFLPMAGGAAGLRDGEMPYDGPLKPGDAVGVTFVSGDLELGATGTVTHIEGDRVYAFGHPMYNLGPTQFPMTRAYVYTVLPSLMSSSKLSATNEVIGTFLQDRATAIAGRLGPGPALLPVTLTLDNERGGVRNFTFNVVRDQMFTPLMTYAALVNTLGSYERQFGTTTFSVQGKISLQRYAPIAFENTFTGDGASTNASAFVVAPLTALINNDFEDAQVTGMQLTMKSIDRPMSATIERVWIDDPRPRPGRTVPVKVLLRTYRGEDVLRTLPLAIPANATGNLALMVTDGARLAQIEQREARLPQPRTVPQLVSAMNKSRKNSSLYVRLLASDPGAVVNGQLLSSLPPSVLAVLDGDRTAGNVAPLANATLGEWELPTDHVVSGIRTLAMSLTAN